MACEPSRMAYAHRPREPLVSAWSLNNMRPWIFLLSLLCWSAAGMGQTRKVPVIDAIAESQAMAIAYMPDSDPSLRMGQLMAAKDLSDAALFALASSHPGLVEQLVSDEYQHALAYLHAMPAPDVHRLRRGETVIRTSQVLRGNELTKAIELAEQFEFRRFKADKLQATRVGPLDGRVIRVEVTVAKNRKSQLYDSVELAWPSTPERDEQSRSMLSRHFGARPSQNLTGTGSPLPLAEASFEGPDALGYTWGLQDAIILGSTSPVGEVAIDNNEAVDGLRSVRFYADERTRRFQDVYQQLPVAEGVSVRARVLHRAENLEVEFEQKATDVRLYLQFLDAYGAPIGDPTFKAARLSTHTWELLEVNATAPPGTVYLQLGLRSAVSGTSWFDALSLIQN